MAEGHGAHAGWDLVATNFGLRIRLRVIASPPCTGRHNIGALRTDP